MSVIPEYTPQRAYMFTRERGAVRAKIAKMFDLSDLPDSKALEVSHGEQVGAMLHAQQWKSHCEDCARHSNLPWSPTQQTEFNNVARPLLYDIMEGNQMMLRVLKITYDNNAKTFTDESKFARGKAVVDAYVNHVIRGGLSQIKTFGFSDRSALSLGGQVVRRSLNFTSPIFTVTPSFDSFETTEQNVSNIFDHGKVLRNFLNSEHRGI